MKHSHCWSHLLLRGGVWCCSVECGDAWLYMVMCIYIYMIGAEWWCVVMRGCVCCCSVVCGDARLHMVMYIYI